MLFFNYYFAKKIVFDENYYDVVYIIDRFVNVVNCLFNYIFCSYAIL